MYQYHSTVLNCACELRNKGTESSWFGQLQCPSMSQGSRGHGFESQLCFVSVFWSSSLWSLMMVYYGSFPVPLSLHIRPWISWAPKEINNHVGTLAKLACFWAIKNHLFIYDLVLTGSRGGTMRMVNLLLSCDLRHTPFLTLSVPWILPRCFF